MKKTFHFSFINNRTLLFNASLVFFCAVLYACGDDITENNITRTNIEAVESLAEAACDQNSTGKTVFLEQETALYICYGDKWTPLNGNDAFVDSNIFYSSTPTISNSSSSVKENISDSRNGCVLEYLSDGYYNVICGKDSITIRNLDSLFRENSKNKDTISISFDSPVYVGENTVVKITLNHASSEENTKEIDFCTKKCHSFTLSRDGGAYVGELTLNSKKEDISNKLYKVSENDVITAKYTVDKTTMEARASWVLKSKGYVQFNADKYSVTFSTSAQIYLYDYDNPKDTAYVTVSSSVYNDEMKVPLKRREKDIFSGSVSLSSWEKQKALHVADSSYIAVSYYDETSNETQVDSAFVMVTVYRTASFSGTSYWGYDDKAVINVTDYQLDNPDKNYSVRVWSDSDEEGTLMKYYVTNYGYSMTGFIEFTNQENKEVGQLYVEDGDKIYVGFETSNGSRNATHSAIWHETKKSVTGTMVDERDNKTYKIVKVGKQVWMAENLNYSDSSTYAGMKGRSWCYNNSIDSCTKYGRLYTWAAAIDSAGKWSSNGMGCGYRKICSSSFPVRGICPENWHLPDTTEWRTLLEYIGVDRREQSLALYSNSEFYDYGFSALNAGYYSGSSFYSVGSGTYFWSANEYGSNSAYDLVLQNSYSVYRDYNFKDQGHSVRCLKD